MDIRFCINFPSFLCNIGVNPTVSLSTRKPVYEEDLSAKSEVGLPGDMELGGRKLESREDDARQLHGSGPGK